MLQQQPPFAAAAQPQFTDKLFVTRALSSGSLNAVDQFSVGHNQSVLWYAAPNDPQKI
jgi:hypothetical protein